MVARLSHIYIQYRLGIVAFVWMFLYYRSCALGAETARVLPKKVFRAQVIGVQTEGVDSRYSQNGLLEGYTASLNRTVTVSELAAKDPQVAQLVSTLNNLQAGLGDQIMGANLYSSFESQQRTWIPSLQYGVSERTTVGILVPIVRRTVKAGFWADYSNNAMKVSEILGDINPDLQAGLAKFGGTSFGTQFFETKLFTEKGYSVPGSFDRTEFGDLEVIAKFNYYKSHEWLASLAGSVKFPTGSTPALDNIFDKGSGGAAWAVGAQWVEEYRPYAWLGFEAMQKFTYFLPDERRRAVPKDMSDTLPSLLPKDGQVQSVKREQVAQIDMEISSAFYALHSALSFWVAYQYGYKGRDRYFGPGNLYYEGLATGTDWEKHTAEVGSGYSTIPDFQKGKLPVPAELELLWNTTLRGKNTPLASYLRMDLMVYF